MIVLAIDTAASLCAACIYDSDAEREAGRAVLDIGKGHAEHLMTVVTDALEQARCSFSNINSVAVSVGPGSFTGVRVGVSAARGLALAGRIPAIGVSTLEALAAETRDLLPGRTVLVAIGRRPEALYAARFEKDGSALDAPALVSLADLAALAEAQKPALAGDAANLVAEAAGGSFDFGPLRPTADILSYARVAARRGPDGDKPRPLYLRPADAKPQSGFPLPRV